MLYIILLNYKLHLSYKFIPFYYYFQKANYFDLINFLFQYFHYYFLFH